LYWPPQPGGKSEGAAGIYAFGGEAIPRKVQLMGYQMKPSSSIAVRPRIWAKDLLLAFGFTALMVVAARIRLHLPFTPVPVTMQTGAAILSGLILGSRLGAISQLQYMALGLAGVPVFANPLSGPAALMSPSFGYIPGFAIGATLAGWSWQKLGRRGLGNATLAAAFGACAIYATGVPWLAGWYMVTSGWPASVCVIQAWLQGLAPFLGADAVKVAAAAAIAAGMSGRRAG